MYLRDIEGLHIIKYASHKQGKSVCFHQILWQLAITLAAAGGTGCQPKRLGIGPFMLATRVPLASLA